MKTLELRGYKSLRALNAFHALMLGLKMLPQYMGEHYEPFYDRIENMDPEGQEKLIREAALFVTLEQDEVENLLAFCVDKNGVPYSKENLKNLGPKEILDSIVAVCSQIAKIKIDLVSEAEKKVANFSVDPRRVLSRNPNASLEEILNLAFYEASKPPEAFHV